MNFLGSNFSHLGQWVLTLESTVRVGFGETSGFCMSWVSICISYVQDIEVITRGQWRHAIHSLSGRKSGDEISSAVDGQFSAGTTSCLMSLVSNSASSSSVVSQTSGGSLGLYGPFYHNGSMSEWSEFSSHLHQCPWVLDDLGLAWCAPEWVRKEVEQGGRVDWKGRQGYSEQWWDPIIPTPRNRLLIDSFCQIGPDLSLFQWLPHPPSVRHTYHSRPHYTSVTYCNSEMRYWSKAFTIPNPTIILSCLSTGYSTVQCISSVWTLTYTSILSDFPSFTLFWFV